MPSPGSRRPNDVVIVSSNPETLDGLQTYLRDAGVSARSARDVGDCARLVSSHTIAVLLFTDDFPRDQVLVALATLAEQYPLALPVLVTARTDRFEGLTTSERVLVLPRPVWGWAILDAIRAHLEQRPSPRKEGRRVR